MSHFMEKILGVDDSKHSLLYTFAYILNREACTFYRLWIITWQHGLSS